MQQDIFDCQQVTVCNTRSKVRIATWNVHIMHRPGKPENILKDANRMNLDIIGPTEMRWLKLGRLLSDYHIFGIHQRA